MTAPLTGISALGLDAIPIRGALAGRAGVTLTKANLEKVRGGTLESFGNWFEELADGLGTCS